MVIDYYTLNLKESMNPCESQKKREKDEEEKEEKKEAQGEVGGGGQRQEGGGWEKGGKKEGNFLLKSLIKNRNGSILKITIFQHPV